MVSISPRCAIYKSLCVKVVLQEYFSFSHRIPDRFNDLSISGKIKYYFFSSLFPSTLEIGKMGFGVIFLQFDQLQFVVLNLVW